MSNVCTRAMRMVDGCRWSNGKNDTQCMHLEQQQWRGGDGIEGGGSGQSGDRRRDAASLRLGSVRQNTVLWCLSLLPLFNTPTYTSWMRVFDTFCVMTRLSNIAQNATFLVGNWLAFFSICCPEHAIDLSCDTQAARTPTHFSVSVSLQLSLLC